MLNPSCFFTMRSLLAIVLLSLLTAPTSMSAALLNTSSRGMVGVGENVLISGFYIEAEPNELRWVLIRGSGPSLAAFGITNALGDPTVSVYDARGHVVGNNSRVADAPDADLLNRVTGLVGAFPQTSPADSAVLIGLPQGVYSAILRAESGSAGVGLLEVYDAGPVADDTAAQTLSGLAAATPSLSTLATALRLTGLDVVLSREGPLTVFAPTNEAFAALPAGTLDALIANPSQLANVLQYHVTAGRVRSTDLSNNQQVTTLLQGAAPLTVTIADGSVRIKDATVVVADIEAVNGVVHVIDRVLVP